MSQERPNLTSGIVLKIVTENSDVEEILNREEVRVQVLGTKIIDSEERKFRLCLSDGVNRTSTVLFRPQSTSQSDPPEDNAIIDVGKQQSYIQTMRGKRAWFIKSYKLIASPGAVVGAPVVLSQSTSTPEPSSNTLKRPSAVPNTPTKRPRIETEEGEGAKRRLEFRSSASLSTHEIKSLNPYTNKYKILCRVTSKGTLRNWSNSRGEGVVFNVTLQDVSGEILATAFNQTATKLFPIFVEGKAFLVSGAQIKPVKDRRYNSTNHNYEMGLTEHTVVVPVDDSSTRTSQIPQMKLDITKFSDIADKSSNDFVDVVGVVVGLNNAEEISVSKGTRTALKREMTLRDNSGNCVGGTTLGVTLWDDKTKFGDHEVDVNKTIMAIRNAKVSDWKGKSLNVGSGSTLIIDPNISQANDLHLWWNSFERSSQEQQPHLISLSQESNSSVSHYLSLAEIKDNFKNNVDDGRVGYYVLGSAYITEIKRDKMMFKACENCSKKVSEPKRSSRENDEEVPPENVYACKSCNTRSKHFSWRYVLNVGLADFTDHHWATVFDPVACLMLGGVSAAELNDTMDNNFRKFDQILNACQYSRWRLKVKAKVETWQKETRLKLIVIECEKVNPNIENERLLNEIVTLEKERRSLSL